jgi:MFS family permease
LAAAILASVIAYIDESVVNVALPVIAKDLATSVAVIQWVINAYTLCLAAFLWSVAPLAIRSAAAASSSSASPSSPPRLFGAGFLQT